MLIRHVVLGKTCGPLMSGSRVLRRLFMAMLSLLAVSPAAVAVFDQHFDYTSFGSTFGQAQLDVLNYPSINGNYMMTSGDTHRPEMVANGNALAEFYNNFNADYNHPTADRRTPAEEAAFINTYTLNNSANNGPRPEWLILNEISSSQWQLNPGAPSLSEHRTWVIDTVTLLNDVYGYKVITYSPYQQLMTTANAPSWQALAAKSYIAIEAYLSGPEVMAGGNSYASRVAYAQGQYQAAKNSYLNVGVNSSRLFVSEHFASNNSVDDNGNPVNWGRAGLASASDWDSVIQIRQDAIRNVGFDGFLAYNWGGNGMGITQAEQIQHEYYYRSRLVLPSQKPQWLSDNAINVNGTTIPLSWNEPLNWVGGVPNANGAQANFWRTLTANRAITLDGSKTVGIMSFDSPFSYAINSGTGGSIVLNNAGGAATLTSNQGSHTINAGVQLSSSVGAAINAGTITVNGVVSGTGALTKSGAGTLTLNGTNSYTGSTVVQSGKLSLAVASLANAADVYISTGGTLDLKFSGSPDVIDSLLFNGVSQVIGTWGANGNVSATYHTSLITGTGVLQVTNGPAAGDYNNNGILDAADYALWVKKVGASTITNRDPSNTGNIGQVDYNTWERNFGKTAGTGAGAALTAVPEPSAAIIFLFAALLLNLRSKRHRS
jgi:autotransporter-associated beta strand protein